MTLKDKKRIGPRQPITFTQWLKRFLMGLAGVYVLLVIATLSHTIYSRLGVVDPATILLDKGDNQSLVQAFDLLEESHPLGGYEDWHDFGDEKTRVLAGKIRGIVESDRAYTREETDLMLNCPGCWITAFREHRVSSPDSVVPQDRVLLQSLADRWRNATSNATVFLIYLSLIALILSVLFVIYLKNNLWEKIGPLGGRNGKMPLPPRKT